MDRVPKISNFEHEDVDHIFITILLLLFTFQQTQIQKMHQTILYLYMFICVLVTVHIDLWLFASIVSVCLMKTTNSNCLFIGQHCYTRRNKWPSALKRNISNFLNRWWKQIKLFFVSTGYFELNVFINALTHKDIKMEK